MNRFLTASMEAGSGVGQVVPPRTRAVLSGGGGGVSDANAVGSGITVAATSTATPIDTLIRVAVRRRFLTRRAIGLKPDNCGSPARPRCNYGAENLLFARWSCISASVDGIAGSQSPHSKSPDRCQQVCRCLQWTTFRSRSWGRGKPGVAGFRGPHLKGHRQVPRGEPSDPVPRYVTEDG